MTVYIPSFQVLYGRPCSFHPSGFQLIMIFGNRVGSILSTCPYQMSCFRVISSNTVSVASIFSPIYSFVFISSSEILADRLNASISAASILLLPSSYKLQVTERVPKLIFFLPKIKFIPNSLINFGYVTCGQRS